MKKSEAIKAMALVTAIWPQREVSKATVEAYVNALVDLPADALMAAIEELQVTAKFLPSIAELRQCAVNAMPGTRAPGIDAAWAEVMREIRRIGSTRGMTDFATGETIEPQWSHPAIGHAAESIGWDILCGTDEMVNRAHFIRLYEVAAQRETRERSMTPAGRELMERAAKAIGKPLPA